MLPPDWELTREQITSMSYDDLSQFDIDIFMQSYREKMTKVNETPGRIFSSPPDECI